MIQTLSSQEIEQWLTEQHADHPHPEFHKLRAAHPRQSFENLPPRRLLSLAHTSLAWLLGENERPALLVVHEHGVWASSELPRLFGLIRGDACSTEALESRPGHAFAPDQSDRLREAFRLTMCFGWGVRLHAAETARVVQTDHDGHLTRLDPAAPATHPITSE